MRTNLVSPGVLSLRERLHLRTRELALIAGRRELQVKQCDYEQAKQDVTGEKDLNRQNAVLAAPLSRRHVVHHAN